MKEFDYAKLKNKTWDNDILSYCAVIHEMKARQDLFVAQKPAQLEKLVNLAKIQSTEASNSIEGIGTTSTRLRELCAEKTTPRNRDEAEIAGYRDALNTVHENFDYIPLTPNYILQLHGIMCRYQNTNQGGKFKNVQNYISATDAAGHTYTLFTPLPPYATPDAVARLCTEFNQAIADQVVDPLLLIPLFIHDFLCIHPFVDGNGRLSRLLTTLLLYRCGYQVGKYISLETKIAQTKDGYYAALADAQHGWHENADDPTPFIKYLLGVIIAAYRDFADRCDVLAVKGPAVDIVRHAINGIVGKFTKANLLALCPSLAVSTVENALRKLVAAGAIVKHGTGKAIFYTRTPE